uniref:Trypsin alpha-3-like n=1 Tax=Drosophila rhopaloa TaxID=1041015 RepID=A0A6P4FTG6_DRORH
MILPVALPLFLGLCVLVLSEDSEDSEMEVDKCDNTTIGGEPMDIKDAPWTASITVREKAKCVGVIYKLNYILTVAQCVDGPKATTSGWSTISRGGPSLREPCEAVSAYVLRKLDVNLHDPNSCSKDRKRWFNISSGDTVQNICVTRKTESCSFDKGAPMVIDGKLAGILALGDCSKEPEAFINLFHHKAWLESNSKDK